MERYMYRIPQWNGEFRNTGAGWEEYQNGVRVVGFVEQIRTADWITLFDGSRTLWVSLPVAGGQSFVQVGTAGPWAPLYHVDRIERTFTPAQLTILRNDSATARAQLDRVIHRLTENPIHPTAVLTKTRQLVKNIFKINVIDPDVPDLPVQAFNYANLVAEFKTLRSAGFDSDPTFVFEPDYTGPLQAWVIGTTDPLVHISPNHFYMDRPNLVITLIHERAHTVLRLQGHPGWDDNQFIPPTPGEGSPFMTHDQAIKNPYCYEWLTAAMRD
ncbi:hypothetical protein [Streptomyces litchfieldiae]|uniref:Uncharacterized protein n=1 Tax=Streptomyces litchfieldiae TaxID=3075543 RepID=A0ABU2N133_9ACTN|nr:hypothetical protein [Streptomyces sp. DSM 44938]MDT0347617.1 hypothetical protein [Streptomyces sp. DSM 44938]